MLLNTRTLLAAVSLAACAVLAGCSSNDGAEVVTPTDTAPPLSKAEFLLQANQICDVADSQITSLQNDAGSTADAPPDAATVSPLVAEITPIAQGAINRLRSLSPPADAADAVTDGIDEMQSTLDAAQTDPDAIIDPIGIANEELAAYGLTSCFSEGAPFDDDGTIAP